MKGSKQRNNGHHYLKIGYLKSALLGGLLQEILQKIE